MSSTNHLCLVDQVLSATFSTIYLELQLPGYEFINMFDIPSTLTISSLEDLNQFAQKIAEQIQPGTVLALDGPLGAGKTTFVQFLAKHLGITQPIVSPTFTIMHQYPWKKDSLVYHLDCYRLRRVDEVFNVGLTEIIDQKKHLVIIEWPGVAQPLLPDSTVWFEFTMGGNNQRQIVIK